MPAPITCPDCDSRIVDNICLCNVQEARDKMVSDMKSLATATRRNVEMLTALAKQTGKPEDRHAADAAERALIRLDAAVSDMLRSPE